MTRFMQLVLTLVTVLIIGISDPAAAFALPQLQTGPPAPPSYPGGAAQPPKPANTEKSANTGRPVQRRQRQQTKDPAPVAAGGIQCPTVDDGKGGKRAMTPEECMKYFLEMVDKRQQAKIEAAAAEAAKQKEEEAKKKYLEELKSDTFGYLVLFVLLLAAAVGLNFWLDRRKNKSVAEEIAGLRRELNETKRDAAEAKDAAGKAVTACERVLPVTPPRA